MKKIFLTLAIAVGLGFASPIEVSARSAITVTALEHHDGYDYVEYNDGSFAFFYSDGSYVIYMRKHG